MTADKRPQLLFLVLAMAVFSVLFSLLTVKKYLAYNIDTDFTFIDQSLWNTAHGHFAEDTYIGKPRSRLDSHQEFLFAFLAPVYFFQNSAYATIILHCLLITICALAVFYISLALNLPPGVALLSALSYLFCPIIHSVTLGIVRGDTMGMVALFWLVYFSIKNNRTAVAVCAFLVILSKSYSALTVAFFGLTIFFGLKKKTLGAGIFFAGLVWFFVIVPAISRYFGNAATMNPEHHTWMGSTAGESVLFAVRNPGKIISVFLTYHNCTWIFYLLSLYLFLPLLRPFWLITTIPVFFGIAMSPWASEANHHFLLLLPLLFAATLDGLARLGRAPTAKARYLMYGAAAAILVVNGVNSLVYGTGILSLNLREMFLHPQYRNVYHYKKTTHDYYADAIVSSIPPSAAVAASDHLTSHLNHRPYVAMVRTLQKESLPLPEYVIIDPFEYLQTDKTRRAVEQKCLGNLLGSSGYRTIAVLDGIHVFKRNTGTARPVFALSICQCAADSSTAPLARFGEAIELQSAEITMDTANHIGQIEARWKKIGFCGSGLLAMTFLGNGKDSLRVAHTPSYAILPWDSMTTGCTYCETVSFESARIRPGLQNVTIGIFKPQEYVDYLSFGGDKTGPCFSFVIDIRPGRIAE